MPREGAKVWIITRLARRLEEHLVLFLRAYHSGFCQNPWAVRSPCQLRALGPEFDALCGKAFTLRILGVILYENKVVFEVIWIFELQLNLCSWSDTKQCRVICHLCGNHADRDFSIRLR